MTTDIHNYTINDFINKQDELSLDVTIKLVKLNRDLQYFITDSNKKRLLSTAEYPQWGDLPSDCKCRYDGYIYYKYKSIKDMYDLGILNEQDVNKHKSLFLTYDVIFDTNHPLFIILNQKTTNDCLDFIVFGLKHGLLRVNNESHIAIFNVVDRYNDRLKYSRIYLNNAIYSYPSLLNENSNHKLIITFIRFINLVQVKYPDIRSDSPLNYLDFDLYINLVVWCLKNWLKQSIKGKKFDKLNEIDEFINRVIEGYNSVIYCPLHTVDDIKDILNTINSNVNIFTNSDNFKITVLTFKKCMVKYNKYFTHKEYLRERVKISRIINFNNSCNQVKSKVVSFFSKFKSTE